MGTANAALSVLALGLHPKVNLKNTYVMMAGIAGGNPNLTTLGSATWAEWVVDLDMSHHIDPREAPKDWEFGQFHLGCGSPWCDTGWLTGTEVHHLNPELVSWAVRMTKDTQLIDSDSAEQYRKHYRQAAARAKPQTVRCDTVSGAYFRGKLLSRWANWWVDKWTKGAGTYCTAPIDNLLEQSEGCSTEEL